MKMSARRLPISLAHIGLYAATIIAVVYSFFPVYWMIISSLREPLVLYNRISLLPGPFSTKSYFQLLESTEFTTWFTNSVLVAAGTVGVTVVLAVIIAYPLTRLHIPGKNAILASMLVAYMFPPLLLAIPLFSLFVKLGIDDTHFALVLSHTAITLPLAVWLLSGFFKQLPFDVEEAAMVDGCSRLGAFVRVVLPIAVPGLVTVVIFTFLLSWSDYIFALIMVSSDAKKTLPPGIETMTGQYELRDGELMAGSTLIVLPLLIAFIFLNRYFIQGLAAGAVKQ